MASSLLFAATLWTVQPHGLGLPPDAWDEATEATPMVGQRLRGRALVTGGAGVNDPLPLVVVLHGRAARADGFLRHFFGLGLRARVIALEAPRRVRGESGFAWLSQRVAEAPSDQVARELRLAAEAVGTELDMLTAEYPTVGTPIVVGYSQGGMVALTLAAQRPERVGDVIAASSFLPDVLAPAPSPWVTAPRVRLVHGRADAIVTYRQARSTLDQLRGAAWDVELATVKRGHHLDARGWGRVIGELRQAVRARS